MKKTNQEKIVSEMARFLGCRAVNIEILRVNDVSSTRQEVDCRRRGVSYRVIKEDGRITSSSIFI